MRKGRLDQSAQHECPASARLRWSQRPAGFARAMPLLKASSSFPPAADGPVVTPAAAFDEVTASQRTDTCAGTLIAGLRRLLKSSVDFQEGSLRVMPASVRSRVSAFQSQAVQFLSSLQKLEDLANDHRLQAA